MARAPGHGRRPAVVDATGEWSYEDLLVASAAVAGSLLAGRHDLAEDRVAYLLEPGFRNVAVQWGIWRAGGVAVPLAVSHPPTELGRLLADARPRAVVTQASLATRVEAACSRLGTDLRDAEACLAGTGPGRFPRVAADRRALMIYTSGTTGAPKGVVTTHANVTAQLTTLVDAWGWTAGDRILHVLPLHHVHGLINALGCAMWAGAVCELAPFEPEPVWERLASGQITLFMAVPTIYRRLIARWEEAPRDVRRRWAAGAGGLRLMVSGSAALPVETLERWEAITGHRLLERYGMTEIGMALSNPLAGERRAGTVGTPLPGVEARIVDEEGDALPDGRPGEIEVRGPQVFLEYWERPEETRRAFRNDWFRTGDVAVVQDGAWRILGRSSVDIIKTGGYKVSALEIEEVLRGAPGVSEVAVVGVADPDWGERVCAAVVPEPGREPDPAALRAWCRERMAPYKVPKDVILVPDLPRNAMGKVTKPALRERFRG